MVPGSWSGSGGLQSPPEAGLGEGLGGEGGRERGSGEREREREGDSINNRLRALDTKGA